MKRFVRTKWKMLVGLFRVALPAILLISCSGGAGQSVNFTAPATSISLTQVVGGFTNPLAITNAGDGSGRLFVVEQGGAVKIVRNGAVAAQPFLN
ncbi:MAG: hypothetical protein H7X83_11225, partial [Verrucomicrobia bacterium]|nr:hypothetical protein [Deltaproteobacteria bacterium]